MAADPVISRRALPACRLQPFTAGYADLVMSWVTNPREAYWLAPRTPPPLTATEVLHWQVPGHQSFLLLELGRSQPIGYGELNILTELPRRMWLGHLIVDPAERGRGCGIQLTRLLMWRAFYHERARDVTLVVFPENQAAIAAYRAAGLRDDGHEVHEFAAYGRVRLLRMAATGVI